MDRNNKAAISLFSQVRDKVVENYKKILELQASISGMAKWYAEELENILGDKFCEKYIRSEGSSTLWYCANVVCTTKDFNTGFYIRVKVEFFCDPRFAVGKTKPTKEELEIIKSMQALWDSKVKEDKYLSHMDWNRLNDKLYEMKHRYYCKYESEFTMNMYNLMQGDLFYSGRFRFSLPTGEASSTEFFKKEPVK